MDAQQFKRLLIDTASHDDYAHKDEVVNLLKLTEIRFEKTGTYARLNIWDQYQEFIYLTIAPSKLAQLKSHSDYIKNLCHYTYPLNDEYALFDVFFRPGIVPENSEVSQEILFTDIQKQIIDEIRSAKYIIWIAMAWFTDPVLYKELLLKKSQGVTIEILIDNNEQNRNAEFDLSTEFPTHYLTIQSLYKNIMHDKFCVIDLFTVIHGSFNWTKAANYNKETISIDKNRTTAEAFADEFIKLKIRDNQFTSES